jgi:hypothetical protein
VRLMRGIFPMSTSCTKLVANLSQPSLNVCPRSFLTSPHAGRSTARTARWRVGPATFVTIEHFPPAFPWKNAGAIEHLQTCGKLCRMNQEATSQEPLLAPEGEGVCENRKTTNPPESKRKPGGQPGNRNALKTGLHTAQIRAFDARVRACRKRVRALLKLAEAQLSLTSPYAGRSASCIGTTTGGARRGKSQNTARVAAAPHPPRCRASTSPQGGGKCRTHFHETKICQPRTPESGLPPTCYRKPGARR